MGVNLELQAAILTRCLEFLHAEFRIGELPSYYITEVHREIKRSTGNPVPFRELRDACNRVGMKLASRLEKRLKVLPEKEQFFRSYPLGSRCQSPGFPHGGDWLWL